MLDPVVVMGEGAAGVVGRVDEDAFDLAGVLAFQRLQRQQVVAMNQQVVVESRRAGFGLFEQIGGGRRCGTVGKRLVFEQDARFQPGAVLFAGPGEFKFGRGGLAGFVGHPEIHSSEVNCASRPFFSRLAA